MAWAVLSTRRRARSQQLSVWRSRWCCSATVSSSAATSKRSFSVNGSVRIEAEDRAGRERLLRYCAQPPFALDRLRELDSERLVYDHPKRGPGGSGPLLLTPLELLDCLAALVPPPRVHRHRYCGVLARTAAYRKFPCDRERLEVGAYCLRFWALSR